MDGVFARDRADALDFHPAAGPNGLDVAEILTIGRNGLPGRPERPAAERGTQRAFSDLVAGPSGPAGGAGAGCNGRPHLDTGRTTPILRVCAPLSSAESAVLRAGLGADG